MSEERPQIETVEMRRPTNPAGAEASELLETGTAIEKELGQEAQPAPETAEHKSLIESAGEQLVVVSKSFLTRIKNFVVAIEPWIESIARQESLKLAEEEAQKRVDAATQQAVQRMKALVESSNRITSHRKHREAPSTQPPAAGPEPFTVRIPTAEELPA